ncbi:hypothetical protein BVC80_9075g105 [Macleaya cordata]|uniref:Uncharacterized protein n=1 Tax=Macleaya cordata TaxID=56857 RepID=A0A200PUI5_MACCD|nr:hypothetical protein BVC80_9075g105 [Macleaya cordata]
MSKRQEQMKHFEPKGKKSKKANKKKGADQSAANVLNKDSGYKDAHFPVNRDSNAVDPNLERFIKYMKSLNLGPEGTVGDADTEEGSSSDFDFDAFMDDTDELYEELKFATMMNSFFHANEQSFDNEGTSNDEDESEDELTPTELKSLVDFFPSQQGLCLPRSASTFLGLIGQQLPKDARKGSLKNARKGPSVFLDVAEGSWPKTGLMQPWPAGHCQN